MRSKTAKKIFSETSEETKEKVKQKTNEIIMKQTAVEFLHSEYIRILDIVTPEQVLKMVDALAQAKEIEKQQIVDALDVGYQIANKDARFKHIKTSEQYYKETFNK